MDNQDIRTLKILEEIDTGSVPSQRDLAKKLNVSLGLVNSFIKRLAQKGYFKITTIPKNRVRYILTPKGAAEKVRLTYEYIQYSVRYYRDARKKLAEVFEELNKNGVQRIVFYGVNDLAEIAYISLMGTSLELVGVIDSARAGKNFMGVVVVKPATMVEIHFDRILITDISLLDELQKILLEHKISANKVTTIE